MTSQCWWCQKRFVYGEAKRPKKDLYECPNCGGWTGVDKVEPIRQFDVIDPKKNMEELAEVVCELESFIIKRPFR